IFVVESYFRNGHLIDDKLWKKSHELLFVGCRNKFNCQPAL
ncbi:unnamed protein product, partial [Tenebrio molitor]